MLAGSVILVVVLLALLPAAEGVGIVLSHVYAEGSSILIGFLPLISFLTALLILCSPVTYCKELLKFAAVFRFEFHVNFTSNSSESP